MDLELSEDQLELDSVALAMLDQRAPLSLAREFLEGGGDAGPLLAEVVEMGWLAVGLEAEDPFGVPGLCLLARAVGAHVAPVPLVDTAVAARLAAGVAEPSDLVAGLAAGEIPAALGLLEETADWSLDGLATRVAPDGEGFVLEGTKLVVHHAGAAGALAVIAILDGAPAVCFVDPGQAGVEVTPLNSIDPTAAACTVALDGVRVGGGDVLQPEAATELLPACLAVGAVATGAEAQGAASRVLDMAIEYAKEREQFGRPIGQFESLQAVLAEAHVTREMGWSTILYAGAALEEGTPDAYDAARIAKAFVSASARQVTEAALQAFGGVAFTWEFDAHLFQRRVLSAERRFGDTIAHERTVGAALLAAD